MALIGKLDEKIAMPAEVSVQLKEHVLTVTAKGKSLRRKFRDPRVSMAVKGKEVEITSEYPRRREKALAGTWAAHVRNMAHGVTKGWRYEMKVVFSHFPIKVGIKGDRVVIDNFLGEKFPRGAPILADTKVDIQADILVLTGTDIEAVSQTAAAIEQATRVRGFDPRIFQDGIYITKKAVEVG